jgi:hypothetical protein
MASTATEFASHAFGLEIEAGFALEGLPECEARGGAPTRVELAPESELSPAAERVTLVDEEGWRLEHCAGHGFVLTTDEYGRFAISDDGRRVRCAPPAGDGWQYCLRGQALPFAAVLRGFETFHASAVALEGRALAFSGHSTAGKTSVAVNLLVRGAELLTDDVLALELGEGPPLAHPGAAVVSLRHAEAAALGAPLGSALEADDEATRTVLPRHEEPLPLGALYFLDRGGSAGVEIEPVPAADPRLLLAASFNFVVQSPERLRNQLDVCARIAAQVPIYRVLSGPDATAADVAEAIAP